MKKPTLRFNSSSIYLPLETLRDKFSDLRFKNLKTASACASASVLLGKERHSTPMIPCAPFGSLWIGKRAESSGLHSWTYAVWLTIVLRHAIGNNKRFGSLLVLSIVPPVVVVLL